MASQADDCSRSALHEDSSALPTDHFNPFDFVDDLSLLYLMKFFSRSDASRFARTSKRNYRFYKAHDLLLRPLSTVGKMSIDYYGAGESILDCRNTDDSLRKKLKKKLILQCPTVPMESRVQPDFVLHTNEVEAKIFTRSWRGSNDPEDPDFEGYPVVSEAGVVKDSDNAHMETERVDSEVSEPLGLTWLFNCEVVKGDKDRALQLLAGYLIKRIRFDKLRIRDVREWVVDFAIGLDFPWMTTLRLKFHEDCELDEEEATKIGIPRLLRAFSKVRELGISGQCGMVHNGVNVESSFITSLPSLDSLKLGYGAAVNGFNDDNFTHIKIPNLSLYESEITPDGIIKMLHLWKLDKFHFNYWSIRMKSDIGLCAKEFQEKISSIVAGRQIRATVRDNLLNEFDTVVLDTRKSSLPVEEDLRSTDTVKSEGAIPETMNTFDETDEEVHKKRELAAIKARLP